MIFYVPCRVNLSVENKFPLITLLYDYNMCSHLACNFSGNFNLTQFHFSSPSLLIVIWYISDQWNPFLHPFMVFLLAERLFLASSSPWFVIILCYFSNCFFMIIVFPSALFVWNFSLFSINGLPHFPLICCHFWTTAMVDCCIPSLLTGIQKATESDQTISCSSVAISYSVPKMSRKGM